MSILRFARFAVPASMLLTSAAFVACSGDDTTDSPTPDAGSTGDATAPTDAAPKDDAGQTGNDGSTAATSFLYTESNDITPNGNTVIGFARNADGSLTALAGSPFATGGTGISNPTQSLGPDDSDQELITNAAHTLLFAVNAGSNSIAVFHIGADGALTKVTGSPFPSGGISPVSVGVSGNFLYVVNQDGDPLQDAAASAPNYTVFSIGTDGALTAVPNSTVTAGSTPSIALVSPDGKHLFGADFLAPLKSMPAANPLRSFTIGTDGKLTEAAGSPMAIPVVAGGMPEGTPVALGLAVHPTQNILYANFTLRSQVGVYTFDAAGVLTYVGESSVTGPAPCWERLNKAGSRLYVTTTGNNTVSVLDTSNPMAPTEIQSLQLADSGPQISDAGATSSESFEEELSADGKFLYVLSQRSTTDTTYTGGNVLHVLSVGADGKLTETVPDVKLTVSLGSRPQGVVTF